MLTSANSEGQRLNLTEDGQYVNLSIIHQDESRKSIELTLSQALELQQYLSDLLDSDY